VQRLSGDSLFKVFSKIIAFTALMIVLLWLLFKVSGILLVFILAMVFALIRNDPVSWLEKRNIKRVWASTIVFACLVLVIGLISWLIIPKIAKQFQTLINNLPVYVSQINAQLNAWLKNYPDLAKEITSNGDHLSQIIPNASSVITKAHILPM
jgi:predicted PurR-regulated permease PerM